MYRRKCCFKGQFKDRIICGRLTCCEQIFPGHRSSSSRPMGPGVEIKEDPIERRRRSGREMDAYTSLE